MKNIKLDIAYIQLRQGKCVKTVEVYPGMLIDVDKAGKILGIEVLSLDKLAPAIKTKHKVA